MEIMLFVVVIIFLIFIALLLIKPAKQNEENSWGSCERCGTKWNKCKGHKVAYDKGRGMFPICESCWAELTPEGRLPFYQALALKWMKDSIDPLTEEQYQTLTKNVLKGD